MRYTNKREMKILDVRNRNRLIQCKNKQEKKKIMNKKYYYCDKNFNKK